MDPTPESKPEEESQETLIPKETATALGRGLNQLLREPIGQIRTLVESLKNNPQLNQDQKSQLKIVEDHFDVVNAISNNLEQAKESKIVPFSGGWDFRFSEEKETQELPTQIDITLGENTTPKVNQLRSALQHNFNNALSPIVGYLSFIESSAQDSTIQEQALEAFSIAESIKKTLPIQTTDAPLRISSDPEGIITIAPVPRESSS